MKTLCEFADPDGHLATWLGIPWKPKAKLRITVDGSAIDIARFKEQIEALAAQGPAVAPLVEEKYRAAFGR
jgi:hypothetical protein